MKRNKWKRLLAFLMVLTMGMSPFSSTVFAEGTTTEATEVEKTETTKATSETTTEASTTEEATTAETNQSNKKTKPDKRVIGGTAGITAASLEDESGTVQPSLAGVNAAFSYGAGGATTSKEYAARFDLQMPASATNIKVKVELAEGLRYVNDASVGISQPSGLLGTVTKTLNTAPAGYTVDASNFTNTGVREYNITPGTTATTLNLTLAVHEIYHFSTISDALKVTLTYNDSSGNVSETVKVDDIAVTGLPSVQWNNSATQVFPIGSGGEFSVATANPTSIYFQVYNTQNGSTGIVNQIAEKRTMEVDFNNPDVELMSTDPGWTCTETSPGHWTVNIPTLALWRTEDIPLVTTMPGGLAVGTTITGDYSYTNYYYGGESTTAASKRIKFYVSPNNEDMYVQYGTIGHSVGMPSAAISTNSNLGNFSSDTTQGLLGYFYVGNRGIEESAEKVCEIHFDNIAIGVTGGYIPLQNGKNITSIEYQSEANPGVWKTATVNLTGSSKNVVTFTQNVLGLSGTDYITAMRYDFGKMAGGQSANPCHIVGAIKNQLRDYECTIEVKDKDLTSLVTTGVGKFKGKTNQKKTNSLNYTTIPATRDINAGEVASFSTVISSSPNGLSSSHNIVYLRSESKIPFSNIKVTSDVGGDITSACAISHFTDGTGADVTKIDMTSTDGYISTVGRVIDGNSIINNTIQIDWELQTLASTPSANYNYNDMIYIDVTNSSDSLLTAAEVDNTYGLPVSADGTMVRPVTGNRVNIRGRGDLTVTTTAKSSRAPDSAFALSNPSNPILVSNAPAGGTDLNIEIKNNSGSTLNNPSTVYVPIPKAGENWGSLQDGTFDYSLKLKGPVTDKDSSGFTIYYGTGVTPTDSGTVLSSATESAKFSTTPPANLADVNCIKIVTTAMTGESSFNFRLPVNVQESTIADGLLSTWYTYYYQDVTTSDGLARGYYKGQSVSAQTAMGEIKGELFNDADLDGVKIGAEGAPSNATAWTLELRKADDGTLLQSIHPDASGAYEFTDLSQDNAGTLYYLQVINPDNTSWMFSPVVTQTASNKANAITTTGEHEIGRTEGNVATYIHSQLANDRGTYNIGVSTRVNKEITFKSSDATTNGIPGVARGELTLGAATGDTVVNSGLYTDDITIPTVAAKPGYVFSHWSTAENGTLPVLPSSMGNAGKIGRYNSTYWAVWSPITYSVKYDLDGGNIAGTTSLPDKVGLAFADTGLLPTGTPVKAGYTFAGWKAGSTTVTAGTAYSSLVADDTVTSVTLEAQWTPKTYTVKYNLDGGTVAGSPTVADKTGVAFDQSGLLPSSSPVKTGYTFNGWKLGTAAVSAGTKYSSLVADDTVINITLKADWTAKSYTVKYDLDGGNIAGSTTIVDKTGVHFTDTGLLPSGTPVKTGYTFTGWKVGTTTVTGTDTYSSLVSGDTVMNVTMKATWTQKSYTVKYDLDGGELSGSLTVPDKTGVHFTDTGLLPSGTPIKAGFTFAGWKVGTTDVTAVNAYSSLVSNDTVMEVTLKAQWSTASYTVKYDLDGGNIAGNTVLADKTGVGYTDTGLLPSGTPVKAGYSFTGWKAGTTDATAGSTYASLVSGPTVMNVTIKAQWTVKNYTVNYDLDGGTLAGSGTVAAMTGVHYSDTGLVPSGTPVRAGYTFGGWKVGSTTVTGTNAYSSLVSDDTVMNVTIKADWTAKSYTVKYDLAGGNIAGNTTLADKTGIEYGESGLLPVGTPIRAGYTFTGWKAGATTVSAVNPYSTLVANDTIMNVTIEAQWTAKTYTVNYDLDGGEISGSGTVAAMTGVHYDDTGLVPSGTPVKAGYTFGGWKVGTTTATAGSTYASLVGSDDTIMNITVKAQWNAISYTVKYDLDGGTLAGSTTVANMTGVGYNDTGLLPSGTPVKAGYTFGGWKVGAADVAATSTYASLVSGPTVMDVTIKAQWTAKTYTVRYDLDGGTLAGSGTIANMTGVTYDQTGLVPSGTPVRAGYTFGGWKVGSTTATSASAYGDLVADDTVTNATMKAQWTAIEYTVKYDLDGGVLGGNTTVADRTNVGYTEDRLLPNGTPSKDGYVFLGWKVSGATAFADLFVTNAKQYKKLVTNDPTILDVTLVAMYRKNVTIGGSTTDDLKVTKKLTGDTPKVDEDFQLQLFNPRAVSETEIVPVTTVDSVYVSTKNSGSAANTVYGLTPAASKETTFGELEFNEPGTYQYDVRVVPGMNTVNFDYDSTVYTVRVVVTESTDGSRLEAKVSYIKGAGYASKMEFTSTYKTGASSILTIPTVTNTVVGITSSETFTYCLSGTSGAPLPATTTKTIKGNGKASFGKINYTKAGVYTYTIKQDAGKTYGYVYDGSVYTIKVTVEDVAGKCTVTKTEATYSRPQKKNGDGKVVIGKVAAGTKAKAITYRNVYSPKQITYNKQSIRKIKVSWKKKKGAKKYVIYVKEDNKGKWKNLMTVGNVNKKTVYLPAGRGYSFRVRPFKYVKKNGKSVRKYYKVYNAKEKNYPKNVVATYRNVAGYTGYVIDMKLGKGKFKTVKTSTKGGTISYSTKQGKVGTYYTFRLRGYKVVNGKKVYTTIKVKNV